MGSSTSFLLKFIQGLIGENLLYSNEVKSFVKDLYIVVGWEPDPPNEPKWGNEKNEEQEGFGIVEFTCKQEE